jgi:hypothetical protein
MEVIQLLHDGDRQPRPGVRHTVGKVLASIGARQRRLAERSLVAAGAGRAQRSELGRRGGGARCHTVVQGGL